MPSAATDDDTSTRPRTEELAPGIHAYIQPHGGWCVSNAGIIVGDETVVVVDTAATEARARALLDTVLALAPGRRQFVVNTHHHGDHTFGNCVFAPGATLIAHENISEALTGNGLEIQGFWPHVSWGRIEVTLPTVTMSDRLTLRTGGTDVELLHFGTAHTKDDVVAWCPEERVLFAGDLLFSGGTPFALMGSVEGLLDVLGKLRELGPRLIVSGHGEVSGPEVIDANEAYLRWVRDLARTALADGVTPLQAALRADLGPFAELPESERIVANLHRACYEENGGPRGGPLSTAAIIGEMVEYNGGRPLPCIA
jgi:cyclase